MLDMSRRRGLRDRLGDDAGTGWSVARPAGDQKLDLDRLQGVCRPATI